MDSNITPIEKIVLELTPKEAFILKCALQDFSSIDDSEFQKVVDLADGIFKRIPDTGMQWSDVAE